MQNYEPLRSEQLQGCGWYETFAEIEDSYCALVTVATCHISLARTVTTDMITLQSDHAGATWITVTCCRAHM